MNPKIEIVGNRTVHPRHGAQSDIRLRIDGIDSNIFARYSDAYQAALGLTDADKIYRNGKIARRPA